MIKGFKKNIQLIMPVKFEYKFYCSIYSENFTVHILKTNIDKV